MFVGGWKGNIEGGDKKELSLMLVADATGCLAA
jgi:hypothetical protein